MWGAASRAAGLPRRQQGLCGSGGGQTARVRGLPEPHSSCAEGGMSPVPGAMARPVSKPPTSKQRRQVPPTFNRESPGASPLQQPHSDFPVSHAPTQPVKPLQNPGWGPAGRAETLPTHPGHRQDREQPRRGDSVTRRSHARPAVSIFVRLILKHMFLLRSLRCGSGSQMALS